MLVAVALIGTSMMALAQEAKKPAAPAKPAVKAAEKERAKPVEATIIGKLEMKTVKAAAKGKEPAKEVKECYLTISEAKDRDGKELADLKGKVMKVMGKMAECEKLAGKEVQAKAIVREPVKTAKVLDVISVAEKAAEKAVEKAVEKPAEKAAEKKPAEKPAEKK